jgi:NTE family protein
LWPTSRVWPSSKGSPYDFSCTGDHIERAIVSTDAWLAQGGLEQHGVIPHKAQLRSH